MSDLEAQIEEAVRKGAKLKDIAAHLDQSEDPSHKAWANTYLKRSPIEAATPTNEGPSEGFGSKVTAAGAEEKNRLAKESKGKEVNLDVGGQSFAIPEWLQLPLAAAGGGAAVVGTGMLGRKLFGGGQPPADVTGPTTQPSNVATETPAISKSAAQQQIDDIRLQREQLKLEQERIKHENFVRQNTLSEAEQAFGRKAKDPTELRLMQTALQQQSGKAPVAPAQAAPAPVAPTVAPQPAPIDLKNPTTQPTWGAPVSNPALENRPNPFIAPEAQAVVPPVQPANVVSTGPTPEAAAAPIEKAEEVKAVTTPKKVKAPISPEDAKLSKQELGMKKHLLGMYGEKENPLAAAKAYETVKEILGYTPAYPVGEGGSLNPEEKGKVLGYRKENIAGPKVNITHDMKKILKKGGPAVAVLAASTEFANAKTAEQKATAGTNLLGAILPPGADILEAGAPTIGQQSILDAYKFGSPYAQTEEAKKARLKEKAGAGRGIAPPSAYMR